MHTATWRCPASVPDCLCRCFCEGSACILAVSGSGNGGSCGHSAPPVLRMGCQPPHAAARSRRQPRSNGTMVSAPMLPAAPPGGRSAGGGEAALGTAGSFSAGGSCAVGDAGFRGSGGGGGGRSGSGSGGSGSGSGSSSGGGGGGSSSTTDSEWCPPRPPCNVRYSSSGHTMQAAMNAASRHLGRGWSIRRTCRPAAGRLGDGHMPGILRMCARVVRVAGVVYS